jgi:hypothetical protein
MKIKKEHLKELTERVEKLAIAWIRRPDASKLLQNNRRNLAKGLKINSKN